MFADRVVNGFGQKLAQDFGTNLVFVARADDGAWRVSGAEAGNLRGLAVLIADPIVSAADERRLDLDANLFTRRRDVCQFSLHTQSCSASSVKILKENVATKRHKQRNIKSKSLVLFCGESAKGGTRTPTPFRYQILSLARLPIPPLSHERSAF